MNQLNKLVFGAAIIFISTFLFAQDSAKVEVFKLTDNLYKLTLTTNFSVNMVVSIGSDGVLLVDDGTPQSAKQLKSKLDELSKKKIKYIINTHFHTDHTGGNQLLGKDAKIIGHTNIKKQLTSGLNILQEFPEEALPQIEFDNNYTLNFNGEEIKLLALPGSHTNSDIVVHFTKSNVVCLGAIITSDNFPFIGGRDGGSFKNYAKIVQNVINLFPEDAIFVVGHGRNITMDDIKKYHEMLTKTGQLVSNELDKGKTVEQIQKDNILKDWESWGHGFVTTNRWIQTIANGLSPQPMVNKESIAIPLYYTLKDKNIDAAIKQYDQLKKDKADVYDFREFNLNLLGYSLLGKNEFEDAIQIFKLNVKNYPESANVYDSLGEAFENSGNLKLAEKNYKIAVQNAEKTKNANLELFKTNLKRVQK